MKKTYEIKFEPITQKGIEIPKHNVYYYEDDKLVDKQFHSIDGIDGFIKENYINKSPSTSELIEKDKKFGNKLLDEFLKDNRDLKTAFSMTTSINVLQKFQAVKGLSEVGDIKNVKKLIENTAIDDIFTQERKDKYVLMCANYLGS